MEARKEETLAVACKVQLLDYNKKAKVASNHIFPKENIFLFLSLTAFGFFSDVSLQAKYVNYDDDCLNHATYSTEIFIFREV